MIGHVTSSFTSDDTEDLLNEIGDVFRVNASDIDYIITYFTRGSMRIDNYDKITHKEMINDLRRSFNNLLGISQQNLTFTISDVSENKHVINYEISHHSFNLTNSIKDTMRTSLFRKNLNADLDTSIVVTHLNVDGNTEMIWEGFIPESDHPISDPTTSLDKISEDFGFTDSTIEGTT